MKAYAGIGSRSTPKDILNQMAALAHAASEYGYTLRSGAANGADASFEFGCDEANGSKEIYLPWKLFNNHSSQLFEPTDKAFMLAEEVHPAWNKLSAPARMLIARNMHQILGKDLNDPVQFVCCWTKDGAESFTEYGPDTGGTGSAICLASLMDIPVFNLKNLYRYDKILELITLK